MIGLSILILPQYLIDSIITRELRNIIFWTILVVLTNFLGNIIMEYFNAEVYIQKILYIISFNYGLQENRQMPDMNI